MGWPSGTASCPRMATRETNSSVESMCAAAQTRARISCLSGGSASPSGRGQSQARGHPTLPGPVARNQEAGIRSIVVGNVLLLPQYACEFCAGLKEPSGRTNLHRMFRPVSSNTGTFILSRLVSFTRVRFSTRFFGTAAAVGHGTPAQALAVYIWRGTPIGLRIVIPTSRDDRMNRRLIS